MKYQLHTCLCISWYIHEYHYYVADVILYQVTCLKWERCITLQIHFTHPVAYVKAPSPIYSPTSELLFLYGDCCDESLLCLILNGCDHIIHVEQLQQTRDNQPMLTSCWPSVYDAGPTSRQHWINVMCVTGASTLLLQRQEMIKTYGSMVDSVGEMTFLKVQAADEPMITLAAGDTVISVGSRTSEFLETNAMETPAGDVNLDTMGMDLETPVMVQVIKRPCLLQQLFGFYIFTRWRYLKRDAFWVCPCPVNGAQ